MRVLLPLAEGMQLFIDFGFSKAAETATGWLGLVVIFVYSFLIAFILPGVSEVVLFAPLDLGLGYWGRITVIILVSSLGKAAGSLLAFGLGRGMKESSLTQRLLQKLPFNITEWSKRQTVKIAQKYGYAGLALALCVPGFPDTISLYAFSVLEDSYVRFGIAAFIGSVGRLLITVLLITGVSIAI